MASFSDASAEAAYQPPEIDVAELRRLLDGRYAEVRDLVRTNLAEHASVLEDAETMTRADFRERVKDLLVLMAGTGQTGMGFPQEYGGGGDLGASIAAFETLALGDLSLLVKVGVQFGLFGGAVLMLGSKRHHDAHLEDLIAGRLLGCFAMTESGHGSNVQALGTLATYDPATDEFAITTPDDASRKDYIGNAAQHAEAAVVFAQLEVAGEGHGVHAFVVPLRRDGRLLPGIRAEDDGLKMGLNGVDNGRLWFDGVRIPRDNLLNRFADVTDDGRYVSPIDNPDKRFFTMLGTLVQGRVCVSGAGINAAKVALTLAVKYAVRRRQFHATSEEAEELLLDYGLHQRRLFPLLAENYALHFAQERLALQTHDVFSVATAEDEDEQARRELESRAAGTKALGTWHATRAIQECREACGGAGYLAVNRFAALKADTDVFTTFEGDNHVLLQLVAKGLLTNYASEFEDLDQLGMVRFVAGAALETVIERTAAHKLLEAIKDALPGGADWDRRGGAAGPGVPPRDAPLPRGAHAVGSRPPAQARNRRRPQAGRGLLPRPGPRARRRPVSCRAAGARGVRRQGRRPTGRRSQGRRHPAPRPARPVNDRAGPRVVHGARSPHVGALEGDHA